MLKKRLKLIIIIGVAAVALIIAYFAVVGPLIAKLTATEEEIPELLPGEVLGTNNRILMFEHIEQAGIQEIEVHNSYGVYAFYRNEEDDTFYIKDMESAPYMKTALSSLVVSAGYTLSMERVTTDCQDMSEYGLAESDNPAWYVLTTLDGTQHKVYIGNAIPTGAGYYVRYDGRNAVYILSSDIATTLLNDVKNFIEPILSLNLGSTDYFTVHDFYIMHYDDCVLWVDYIEDGVETDQPNTTSFEMKYPANYIPSSNYETMLQTFIWFEGTQVVAIDEATKPLSSEVLAQFGIDSENPAWVIHYTYNDYDSFVYLSEKQADGTYYAYSLLFNMVAIVDAETVEWLEWDFIEFVDSSTYMLNINDIAKIEVISDKVTETFTLDGEGDEIKITPKSTMKTFGATDLKNFRQLYKTFLGIKMEGYADNTDKENLVLTLRYTTDAGKIYEFKFYQYSSRRCFYTVNGVGEFYVLYDCVEKAINDTIKAVNGETIDSWAKN